MKLNPVVVKEVFNRLLGTGNSSVKGAMAPADLMIALHNIDPAKCDMKTIIKATGLCFQEKTVFTMEVLTIVLTQLMDQKDIPLLLMRTVIQSVALYPNLIGFTMNVLQRLIVKQVWRQKMLWEGFIKCCERTKPQSFRVLLQVRCSSAVQQCGALVANSAVQQCSLPPGAARTAADVAGLCRGPAGAAPGARAGLH